nr:MAG TPA: hypothetical protein [Caudoviricetes sp.]
MVIGPELNLRGSLVSHAPPRRSWSPDVAGPLKYRATKRGGPPGPPR